MLLFFVRFCFLVNEIVKAPSAQEVVERVTKTILLHFSVVEINEHFLEWKGFKQMYKVEYFSEFD